MNHPFTYTSVRMCMDYWRETDNCALPVVDAVVLWCSVGHVDHSLFVIIMSLFIVDAGIIAGTNCWLKMVMRGYPLTRRTLHILYILHTR